MASFLQLASRFVPSAVTKRLPLSRTLSTTNNVPKPPSSKVDPTPKAESKGLSTEPGFMGIKYFTQRGMYEFWMVAIGSYGFYHILKAIGPLHVAGEGLDRGLEDMVQGARIKARKYKKKRKGQAVEEEEEEEEWQGASR